MDEVRRIMNKWEVTETDPEDVEQWRVLIIIVIIIIVIIYFNFFERIPEVRSL
jgi:t-SNARE complex subunit (syntaxin)